MITKVVHILKHGFAFCGKPGLPASWPDEHVYVSVAEVTDTTPHLCVRCFEVYQGKPLPPPLLKQWPANPKEMVRNYKELLHPLRGVMLAGYNLQRRPVETIPYDGYTIGSSERTQTSTPDVAFTKEQLQRRLVDGEDLIDVVLHYAFLLGVEQGRRHETRYRLFTRR